MKIEDIQWTYTCCGESCKYAEVEVAGGWLQVKTNHDDEDSTYQVRRYGPDMMPIDEAYVPTSSAELSALIN